MANKEVGHETLVDGVLIQTRFPLAMFDKEWRDEFVAMAKFHQANPPAGWQFVRLAIDHVNVANRTFHPRIDLMKVS